MAERRRSGRDPRARASPGEDYDAAVEAAEAAVELGVKTICDPTAMFLGRDVEFMRRVAEQTGLQVVAVHRASTPTTICRRSSSAARPSRSPTCSSPTSSRGSRGRRSRPRSSSAPPTSPGVTENVEKVHRAAAKAHVAHRRADHGPLAPR